MGTYNRLEGKQAVEDCIPCSAGYYCSEEGKDKLVSKDECPAKYFCPAGTSDYTAHPCTAGLCIFVVCSDFFEQ